MNWQERAVGLAARIAPAGSRWRPAIASVPRHLLIPRWFDPAEGKIEHYPASFMAARHGQEYIHRNDGTLDLIRHADGEHVSHSCYPVVDPTYGAELDTMLSITQPGIMYDYSRDHESGVATAWMVHPDGSWARASGKKDEPATVHQSGPRRLWDALDKIRHDWINSGWLPVHGARARIDPDGTCHLRHGPWQATIPTDTRAT